jgi:hypothetical protein
MPNLHETQMGVDFFNHRFPQLIKTLAKIEEKMEEANGLKVRELMLMERLLDVEEEKLRRAEAALKSSRQEG